MKHCKPGLRESYLDSKFKAYGLENYNIKFSAYGDIMGSGPHSATLHYEDNNKIIKEDEIILCDCGYHMCGYASDITTCFPSNGKFTPR